VFAGAGWAAQGLVVPAGVEGELAQELTGVFVDHADVAVLDEEQDVGSGVGSADADVVQPAVVAQGDHAGVVDAVVADPLVGGWGVGGRRGGLGSGGVGGGWSGAAGAAESAVRAAGVVVVA
jgi:hypothetical protein